jgi:hypothetical protein
MIDIETLGVGPRAPMFQVGVVKFLAFNTGCNQFETRKWNLDLLDVLLKTETMPDSDTIRWWKERYSSSARTTVTLEKFKKGFLHFCGDPEIQEVWANSPSFDLEIIKHHIGAAPWSFRQERDLRTLRKFFVKCGGLDTDLPHVLNNTHDALDDAIYQLASLDKIYSFFKDMTNVPVL